MPGGRSDVRNNAADPGEEEKWRDLAANLHPAQDASGGIPARDDPATGIYLSIDGSGAVPWIYDASLHTGATGWLVFAK